MGTCVVTSASCGNCGWTASGRDSRFSVRPRLIPAGQAPRIDTDPLSPDDFEDQT